MKTKKISSLFIIAVFAIQMFGSLVPAPVSSATYKDVYVTLAYVDPNWKWDSFDNTNEYSIRIDYRTSSGWVNEVASGNCQMQYNGAKAYCGVTITASSPADIGSSFLIQIIEKDSFGSYEVIYPTIHDSSTWHYVPFWPTGGAETVSNSKGEAFTYSVTVY